MIRLQRWESGPYFAAFSLHIPDMRVEIVKIWTALPPFRYRTTKSDRLLEAHLQLPHLPADAIVRASPWDDSGHNIVNQGLPSATPGHGAACTSLSRRILLRPRQRLRRGTCVEYRPTGPPSPGLHNRRRSTIFGNRIKRLPEMITKQWRESHALHDVAARDSPSFSVRLPK